jgi:hypothetical protein
VAFLAAVWAIIQAIIAWVIANAALFGSAVWGMVKSFGGSIATWMKSSDTPMWQKTAAVYGAAYLVSPEQTTRITEKIGDAATTLMSEVGEVVIDTAGNVAKSLFSNPLVLLGCAGALFLWFKSNDEPTQPAAREPIYIAPTAAPQTRQEILLP